jgi:hypothetical protein
MDPPDSDEYSPEPSEEESDFSDDSSESDFSEDTEESSDEYDDSEGFEDSSSDAATDDAHENNSTDDAFENSPTHSSPPDSWTENDPESSDQMSHSQRRASSHKSETQLHDRGGSTRGRFDPNGSHIENYRHCSDDRSTFIDALLEKKGSHSMGGPLR